MHEYKIVSDRLELMRFRDHVVARMNEAMALDPECINELFSVRVPCNEAIAEHETIQVRTNDDGTTDVSILGIINGFFEDYPFNMCATCEDASSRIISFGATTDA